MRIPLTSNRGLGTHEPQQRLNAHTEASALLALRFHTEHFVQRASTQQLQVIPLMPALHALQAMHVLQVQASMEDP